MGVSQLGAFALADLRWPADTLSKAA